ncbi:hypothetical protein CWI36_0511p0020 [Hamiltosporidium magnivora]|uniref:Uncharacterized protein n=1 Tax=Hamiltosporidium magnivora TaxID=148818 RepID=A0A4Q9LE19_9MICR|nr:hypothetical protein CWI36_0511p0020 [Hamiltosporidium magnivora]
MKDIQKNEKIPKENKDFYLKLLNENKFRDKVKITENFKCKYKNIKVKCFYEYKGCFNNISITFEKFNDKRLEINYSNIYIENEIFLNESIKYFRFSPNNSGSFCSFFRLIDMMIGLQAIYFEKTNTIKLNRSVNQIFYITELYLWSIDKMIDLLQHLAKNIKFDPTASNKDKADLKLFSIPVKFLFKNYGLNNTMKLCIWDFPIDNLNVKAFQIFIESKRIKNPIEKIFEILVFPKLFCTLLPKNIK